MDREQILEMKDMLLDMMRWFHGICISNRLRYYALGGTMLGAVRHQGFIPWDDDIDVGMPRKDYIRLAEVLGSAGQDRYILETPDSGTDDFYYCFSKLYDSHTTLVENTKYHIRRGIYLDIFPLDGMGDTEKESRSRFSSIDRKFLFLLARTTGIRARRSSLKNAAVRIGQSIPSWIINDRKLLSDIQKLSSAKDFDECRYGGNPFGAWRFKEIMPREVMGDPSLYQFEDIQIFGAEHADEYLTHLYGDWRQLPPEEKRVSNHDFLECDLHKSYLAE